MIERSGAALAEVVSCPERVSLLSQAVRCLDGDLRVLRASATAQEEEVGRSKQDLARQDARVKLTEGIPALKQQLAALQQLDRTVAAARKLRQRLRAAEQQVAAAEHRAAVGVPDSARVRDLVAREGQVRGILAKMYRAEIAARHASASASVAIPDRTPLRQAVDRRRAMAAIRDRVQAVQSNVSRAQQALAEAQATWQQVKAARAELLAETPYCMLCERPL